VLQTPRLYTLPVGLAMLSSELGTDWPTLLASATMATLPVALLFLVAQRPFARATEIGGLPVT